MKCISMILVAVVTLTLLIAAYSQTRQSGNQSIQTSNDQLTKEQMAKAKAKKVLVKSLPKGVEGVELKDGIFRLKPGFKWVSQPDGTIAAARNNGGAGLGGSFDCQCTGTDAKGKCVVATQGSSMGCVSHDTDKCSGTCTLTVFTGLATTRIAIY
jgi:hypothetical protein